MKYADLIEKLEFDDLKEIVEKYSNKQIKLTENIFETINMREDSHSRLLLWLLNAKGKDKNSLQYRFLKNFIKLLDDLGYISDVDVDDLAGDIEVTTQESCKPDNTENSKSIDILLSSQEAKFICVIENKLDAKINVDDNGVTQLEYYYNFVNQEDYNEYKKLCLFLCPSTQKYLKYKNGKDKKVKAVCNKDKIKLKNKDYTNEKFSDLLDNLDYKSIEHSDIALILYQTLLNSDGFDCDAFMSNEARNNFLKKISDIKQYENTTNYDFEIDKLMKELSLDKQREILREYVQYWEFYAKFVEGYSKIVPTKIKDSEAQYVYMWNVCNKIKKFKDKPEYEKLKNIVKEIAPK